MSFTDLNHRLTEAVMDHLHDTGVCVYTGETLLTGVDYILDHEFEVFDQDQVAQYVSAISVKVDQVPCSRQGDTITTPTTPGITWTVQQTLEDDGYLRVLMVTK